MLMFNEMLPSMCGLRLFIQRKLTRAKSKNLLLTLMLKSGLLCPNLLMILNKKMLEKPMRILPNQILASTRESDKISLK